MKSLEIQKVELSAYTQETLHEVFLALEWHQIDQVSWAEQFPYKPAVQFQIAYTSTHLILHYKVQEEYVKAQYVRANENVWEDSCIEFFVSFDDKKTYYNIEFNVLGTGLIGYGPAVKTERNRMSAEQINSVDVFVKLQKINGVKTWSSILAIPREIFGNIAFEGQTFHANFYKCGDGLPQPHFISWNKIDFTTPNFHQPDFFGEIHFRD